MQTIIITLNNGKKEEYVKGIKVKEILNKMSKEEREDAILIKYNNKKVDLETELKKNGTLQIYDINTLEGNRIYERGLLYLFVYVTNNILEKDTKVIVKHSIDKGIFCKIDKKVEDKDVLEIKKQMKELVSKNIPFTKMDTTKYEAIEYFKSIKREDKAKTLFYDTSKYVSLYKLDENYNYIVGDLPSSTGVLKYFDLSLIKDKGIVVRFPSIYDNKKVKRYIHHTNYFNTLEEYSAWGNNLNINNIGELNDYITSNKPADIIQLSEIMQDYKLLSIAEQIVLNKEDYKIILLSGPSSSGKTTSAMKLSLYLKSLGLNPTHLSLDDYFHERAETPLGEDGKPDFESITAVDIKLFDSQISKLLKGTKVVVPTFNFIDGKKEYKRTVQLKENDILIIEGLHALNEELLTNIPKKKKFKIYVSPLTYLNIDNDNRISMTDLRLLRRMVRDNRTRGYSPSVTLGTWMKVRSGEEKHVFPYQDNADALFNTSLAYELSVLKTYAEPLLFSIKEDDPEYQTAQRLIELLKFVLPIPSESVPKTSILREFIGDSYFE
ncbi:MAG: nucleoside kinase [Bacilli bacterium]|nr:nucleoside kinase [Clostridium sp.]MDY2804389.1 nucleoside kinase [Bacilli bacterium]